MRSTLALAVAFTPIAWNAAGAQGLSAASFRAAPQYVSYEFDLGGVKTKVSEMAIPLAFAMPINSRFSFDVATAFASATVESSGAKSTLSGLTDIQARLNYTVSDALVITAGLNLPTGQYEVAQDKIAAAGQIGNDFLAFPISSFGNGLAGTGGVALARSLGEWNLGLGASVRMSTEFGAYETDTDAAKFTPASEFRLRAGLDGAVGAGRAMFGLVFSQFGEDECTGCADGVSTSTYSTGNRIIGQAAFDTPIGSRQLYIGGWVLHRAEGETVNGAAPSENIENLIVALGMNVGSLFLEPSVEARFWQVDGASAGTLAFFGVRTKFNSGSIEFSPSVAYGVGSTKLGGDADLTGMKVGVSIRLAR